MAIAADAGQLPEKLAIQVKTRRSVAKPAGLDLICLSMISGQTFRVYPERKPVTSHRAVAEGMLFRIMLQLLLPVLGQILIAQVPVLPQLQGRQQHH
jgi:hypothetical protein